MYLLMTYYIYCEHVKKNYTVEKKYCSGCIEIGKQIPSVEVIRLGCRKSLHL